MIMGQGWLPPSLSPAKIASETVFYRMEMRDIDAVAHLGTCTLFIKFEQKGLI